MISATRTALGCIALLALGLAHAQSNGGPLGIDHKLHFDNSGIWSRNKQLLLVNGLAIGTVAGAFWEGGETRLGRTVWQSVDSLALGAVSSEVLKNVVQRSRPGQSDDPDLVRQGKGHYSFPSGEVTAVTALITPFVLEYRKDHPLVYALELLPLYDGVARMKSQAHWQSDVLAGFALGTLTGYYAHQRDSPFILGVMPHGVSLGFRAKF